MATLQSGLGICCKIKTEISVYFEKTIQLLNNFFWFGVVVPFKKEIQNNLQFSGT